MKVLVLNSGSSSLKYQLIESDTEEVLAKGLAERIGLAEGALKYETEKNGKKVIDAPLPNHDVAMDLVFKVLTDPVDGAISSISEIAAVGHRVVHGGEKFTSSVLVTEETLTEIAKVSNLAPLHNPANLMGIKACIRLMPGVPQVTVFDTAFHSTIPNYAYTYALPYKMYADHGIRRYGFHGTSHKYVSARAAKLMAAKGTDPSTLKMVTCHLGNGCSMAAIVGGKVIDTSMGLTPAEGLMMGTRSGDLDPAILLFVQRELNLSVDEVDNLINKKSGLLGISGKSSDMRDIEEGTAAGDERCTLALEIFCYRVRKYIGAYAAAMGWLDAVVFTGGIGENGPIVREKATDGLGYMGIELDQEKNSKTRNEADISVDTARVRTFVIPTNEEMMIARDTVEIVTGKSSRA
ncbi:MAG: acetate kinase [Armatimonadota bacterium]